MTSKELLELLFESSSLRIDLLNKVEDALKDILNNIKLSDELCARLKDETYKFLKGLK